MYKVFFITFGCKVNHYETECIKSCFISEGFSIAETEKEGDIFIVNSCTVTESGDSKSLYSVRRLRRLYPKSIIALTGCLPQTNDKILEKCPQADIITGTKERNNLPALVKQIIDNRQRICVIPKFIPNESFEDISYKNSFSQTRAFMKIQDGCNCFCSYCIIPYARGRCRSKPLDSVKMEAEHLAQAGYREIVLVGINLAFYGKEFGLHLIDAVEECCNTRGIDRVRLGSIEPEMITNSDLERLSRQQKFCPHFHLSLQSGSETILKRMNRKYTPKEYLETVNRIRTFFPEASFTTDIMVGFPGETEEEFEESLLFAEKVGFSKIHVFQYSARKGTPAAEMKQIPQNIKAYRADRMKSLSKTLLKKHLESLVGKTVPVLFEQENTEEFHQGHAPDMTLVKIFRKNLKKSLRNSIFYVIIEESRSDFCIGKITKPEWR